MATLKPRITITLEPHVHEVLRRLSAAGGQSMSSLVTDFLDVAVPPMERMVVVLEEAARMPHKAREELRASVERAEATLLPALAAAADQTDLFIADATKAVRSGRASPAQRVKRGAPKGDSTPVPVTRGLGIKTAAKKGTKNG